MGSDAQLAYNAVQTFLVSLHRMHEIQPFATDDQSVSLPATVSLSVRLSRRFIRLPCANMAEKDRSPVWSEQF